MECAYAEHEEENNSFLGREDFTEVVLDKFLLPKLEEFNPNIPKEVIKEALDVLKKIVLSCKRLTPTVKYTSC